MKRYLTSIISMILVICMIVCNSSIMMVFANGNANATSYNSSNNPSSLVDKIADGLDENDQTNVTLTVPGMQQGVGVDIVYLMGSGVYQSYLNPLKETMLELIEEFKGTDAHVKLGIVTFENTTERETVLPLTIVTEENIDAVIDEATTTFANEKLNYYGIHVNMESALQTAKDMLDADTSVPAERKHLIMMSTGYSWTFDDANGNAATIVGTDYSGNPTWGQMFFIATRNRATGTTYPGQAMRVPFGWSWDKYWTNIKNWVEADGDDYVFTLGYKDANGNFVPTTYEDMYTATAVVDGVTVGNNARVQFAPYTTPTYRYGDTILVPKYMAAAKDKALPHFKGIDGKGEPSGASAHAINYERSMYDSYKIYEELRAEGTHCYAVTTYMYGNRYVGREYFGECFMDMMAGGTAPKYSSDGSYFDPIHKEIIYSCSDGSTVEDFIGKNENGNFEFITNPETIFVTYGDTTYSATQIETKEGATASYTFGDGKVSFELDYFYGDGETTERLVWIFHEEVSLEKKASLTYKLQLTEKKTEEGTYTVPTNNSAILYPVDSKGNKGEPQVFPVPEVEYTVVSSTDIVIKKVDENGAPLTGAEFALFDSNGKALGIATVDANGELTFSNLKVGTYTLVETKTPNGYVGLNEDMTFEVVFNKDHFEVNVKDRYILHFPATAYEISNHSYYPAIPQNFILLNDDIAEGWEYTGEYVFGESDFEVVYCADSTVGAENQYVYTNKAVEDVFSVEVAEQLRAIISNSYPYVTMEDMIAAATAAGVADAANLTRGDIIAAVQLAIWKCTNGADHTYRATYSVMNYPHWGKVFHDYTNELPDYLPKNTTKTMKDTAGAARVEALYDYLLGLEPLSAKESAINVVCYLAEGGKEASQTLIGATRNDTTITVVNRAKTTISISGSKTWNDNNDQDGIRPESITINLFANGVKVASKEVTAADGWTWSFEGMAKYQNGKEIVYTITEDAVAGYGTEINGFNVTNTHAPFLTEVTGTKTWIDNNDQDGVRPESITINLFANGVKVASKEVTAADNWTYTFSGLAKYADGKEIVYTITEDAVAGYTTEINGFNVTNTYAPEVIEVTGTKTWIDNNDQDGIRPESITINLFANGVKVASKEVTAADNWTYTFSGLAKYADGKEIVYTITEDAVAGYETEIDGFNVTNTHETEKTEVTGTKTWIDNNDQDGIRPESITINLFANGVKVASKEVTAADNWTYTFSGLAKYADGKEIVYTITEDAVAGYETEIDGFNVTNTHETEKTEVTGTKTWNDKNNQDGVRPESITINLFANGVKVASKEVTAADNWTFTFAGLDKFEDGKEIAYYITEDAVEGYTTEINGFDVTNTHVPSLTEVTGTKTWNDKNNQDGIRPESITINLFADGVKVASKEVTAADNWTFTFTGLDKFEDGKEIVYTITEDAVAGYTTEINGFNVTNTHEVEKTEVTGTKTWNDKNNQDGKRPESITINLFANGVKVASKEVTAADNWTFTFADLDKYADGKEIVYYITEDAVEGYTTEINGFDVTNTYAPEVIEVSGTKIWIDNNNQDGVRPESITINLFANGVKVASKEVTAADNWTFKFENLDKYQAGVEIVYTITEDAVAGYTTEINGFNVTNTHEVEKTEVTGTKTWIDNNDQDGKRPESITINLFANGVKVASKEVTAADNWTFTFADLDKYAAGEEIVYTIDEVKVEGYETEINGFDVINTRQPEEITISGLKTWVDNNNQDGIRPESITINLFANGVKVATKVVTAEDGWAWTFDGMAKYQDGINIVYTITEDAVAGYTTEINGFNVTNTHEIEKINVAVEKIWDDEDDIDEKRPESITINLFANGQLISSVEVTADEAGKWACMFNDLVKYENGAEIEYTISENEVEEYITVIEGNASEGFVVTNIYTPSFIPEVPPLDPPHQTGDDSILSVLLTMLTTTIMGGILVIKRKRKI